jgi:hypothetical protein
VQEAERDLPANQRPSLISLNGRAVTNLAYKKHASMFPDSRLRLLSGVLMGAFFCELACHRLLGLAGFQPLVTLSEFPMVLLSWALSCT